MHVQPMVQGLSPFELKRKIVESPVSVRVLAGVTKSYSVTDSGFFEFDQSCGSNAAR